MKTLFFDCAMGAAGDMLAGALLELLPDPDAAIAKIDSLGLPGIKISREDAVRCGIKGTRVRVMIDGAEEHEHEHHHHHHHHHHGHHHDHDHHHEHDHGHHHEHDHAHSGLSEIEHVISSLDVSDRVKSDALAVYRLIADAESAAHGVPVEQIHFHEVGTMDAVADVVFVSMLIEMLAPDEICASAVNVGSGHVHCAHGVLPVPAPATAHILRGVPTYSGHIEHELCTPTGAALLKHFATRFCPMPQITAERIGYGMGSKEFEAANCVRAFIGTRDDEADEVVELTFTIDDMTGESIAFAIEELWKSGILEAYTIPISMKKSRPGTLFCVMCREADREAVIRCVFRHTSTIGLRETLTRRRVLDRSIEDMHTSLGTVRCKKSTGYGAKKEKLEFEDMARLAREHGMTLDDIRSMIR